MERQTLSPLNRSAPVGWSLNWYEPQKPRVYGFLMSCAWKRVNFDSPGDIDEFVWLNLYLTE